jgi:hypothetical protein
MEPNSHVFNEVFKPILDDDEPLMLQPIVLTKISQPRNDLGGY